MSYNSVGILCRRCLDADIPEGELIKYLDNYVASLSEDIRVSQATYEARLSACADCMHRIEATCTLCGCYCQARAAKKALRCPIPQFPRWTEEETKPLPECETE